jgi:uncharacterized membrane protein
MSGKSCGYFWEVLSFWLLVGAAVLAFGGAVAGVLFWVGVLTAFWHWIAASIVIGGVSFFLLVWWFTHRFMH